MCQKTNLYVKNLSFNTEPFDIMKLFSRFGEVIAVDIPKNRASGRNSGIALVAMRNFEGAKNVIRNLNGTRFKDFKIKIILAKD